MKNLLLATAFVFGTVAFANDEAAAPAETKPAAEMPKEAAKTAPSAEKAHKTAHGKKAKKGAEHKAE